MRSFIKMLVILLVVVGVVGIHAEEKTWTYGGVEYRVPISAEQLPSDIPDAHTVVSGDTLWGISRAYLTDPYLWPLVWEENLDTIKNPHRIYPGDIVRLPGGMLIATDAVPPRPARIDGMGEDLFDEGGEGSDELKKFGEKRRYSVITEADLISSGLISEKKLSGPEIIAAETTAFDLSSQDVIFVKSGSGVNLRAGEHYFIMRDMHKVKHPISGRNMGRMYHVVGEAEILCTGEEVTSAIITKSYHAIERGDFLVPWENIPMPMTTGSPPFDRCNPSTKTLPGHIIDAYIGIPDFNDAVIIARGDVAYIDLGGQDGVAPGDYFTIFTQDTVDHQLPKYVSGELMVVKVMEETSVVVITQSNTAVFLGDTIELK